MKRKKGKRKQEAQKTEDFDQQMRDDLNRSENEGYAVMYSSEKDKKHS